jgi:hypothetical protein
LLQEKGLKDSSYTSFWATNVYAANFTQDDDFYYAYNGYIYGVDTDVTDILAHTTTIQFKVNHWELTLTNHFLSLENNR